MLIKNNSRYAELLYIDELSYSYLIVNYVIDSLIVNYVIDELSYSLCRYCACEVTVLYQCKTVDG